MSVLYLDTSAIIKRYANEVGSLWLTNFVSPSNHNNVILSEITLVEGASAISLKQRMNIITSTEKVIATNLFLNHCNNEYQLLAPTRTTIDRAVLLIQNHPLRGYDAVQLATALIANEALAASGITDFIFVSADNTLLVAAQAEGLTVENPNNYP